MVVRGLSYIPEYRDMDLEYYPDKFKEVANRITPLDYYSFKNRSILLRCLTLLGLHKQAKTERAILEIGVGKIERFPNTSTFILTQAKDSSVEYIGIDLENRHWLYDFLEEKDSVFLGSSAEYMKTIIDMKFDLLHIDGGHSLKNTLFDWKFSAFVKDTGIIVIHDTKAHPGPHLLVEAIDRDIYTVHNLFLDDPSDFGIAIVYRKENRYKWLSS